MWHVTGLVIVDITAKRTIGKTAATDPRFVPVIDAFAKDRYVSRTRRRSGKLASSQSAICYLLSVIALKAR